MTSSGVVKVSCPCCEHRFEAPVLMSTNTFGGQTTDFHSRAVGYDPLNFVLGTCPRCGFTDYTDAIERGITVSDDLKAKIRSELGPLVHQHKPDAATQFAMLAQILIWRSEDPGAIAYAFLRAAWLSHSKTEELEFRLRALQHFKQALDSAFLHDRARLNYLYLVGELHRRLGETTDAHAYFDQAIAYAEALNDPYADQLGALARDQRDNPRDKI